MAASSTWIIQARSGSTRLPGKVLAEVAGRPMLGFMLDRLRDRLEGAQLVVATSDLDRDDAVADVADDAGVAVVRGPEADVLERFRLALEAHPAEAVVRLTADCPLIDPAVVDEVVAAWREGGAAYVSNVIEPRTYPVGMDAEVVDAAALLVADAEASEAHDREHVTPFVRSRPERFAQRAVRLAEPRPDVRLTLDTPEDLEVLRDVVAATGPDRALAELVAAADARP